MVKAIHQSIRARFRLDWPGFVLDVDLALPGRGVTALFGPSGSGKTTVLRCMAGLERARGSLTVNGVTWQDATTFLPTHRRPLGYVFQEASLFPHLSAQGNLEYGLRRVPAAARRVSLEQAVALLGIGHLLDRSPDRLSGGERQRVAIARALALSPGLLLMDEPLAALDARRKEEILPYLERLHDELEIPVLYVTHAADEVAHLAESETTAYVDQLEDGDGNFGSAELAPHEITANRMAADWLVPMAAFQQFVTATQPHFSRARIEAFAAQQGRHPGIVLGRLQRDNLVPWKNLRSLLVKVSPHLKDAIRD